MPPTNQQQFSCIHQFADMIKPKYTLFLAKLPWKSHPLLAGISAFCEYLHPPHPGTPGEISVQQILPKPWARLGCVAPSPQSFPIPQGPHQSTKTGVQPQSLSLPGVSGPAAVPSLHPTAPRSGNLPPKGRAGCQRDTPPMALFSEIFLSVQNPQQVLHCCPQCHPQPRRHLAAASIRSLGDRNSAAKVNPCRESP